MAVSIRVHMEGRDGDVSNGVGGRLRQLRLSNGLTQQQLAGEAYTAAYVSTIEAGRRMPSTTAITYFASRLQVEPEQILTGRPPNLLANLELAAHEARVALSRGFYDDADRQYGEIAKTARRYGLTRVEGKAVEGRGLVAERRGAVEAALNHFEEAKSLLATEPLPVQVEAVAGISRCTQMMGDVRYAIHVLESYLMQLQALPDPLALMRVHSSLVWPYSEVGLYDRAAAAANEALRLEPRVQDPEQIANMLVNVARELLRQGGADDALDFLRRAETTFASLDWRTEVARAHLARGIVLADRQDLEGARDELMAALDVFAETSSTLNEARTLTELGRLERLSGRPQQALDLLERSISMLREGDITELATAHRELALAQIGEAPELAEKNLRIAIDLYTRAEEPLQVAASYRELGDLLRALGDAAGSGEAYREGLVAIERPTVG